MKCVWVKIGETGNGNIYRCRNCDTVLPPLRGECRVNSECRSGPAKDISLILKGQMILTAKHRWEQAGRPERSDEQVQRLAEQCCQVCKYFLDGHCGLCGCPCRTPKQESSDPLTKIVGRALRNKIRMGTEDCPWKCAVCQHSKWQHVSGVCECGCCTKFIEGTR